jgi:hypothetical protein
LAGLFLIICEANATVCCGRAATEHQLVAGRIWRHESATLDNASELAVASTGFVVAGQIRASGGVAGRGLLFRVTARVSPLQSLVAKLLNRFGEDC